MKSKSPEKQLDGFLAKYTPKMAVQGRAALAKMRARLPGAIQMVYDNYNALVIGFSPNERPSDAIFSIALFPRWVTLCFLQGAGLRDTNRLLKSNGRMVRHIRLADANDLDKPEIQDLITRALERTRVPFDESQEGRLVIQSISENQRPRRAKKE